MGNFGQRDKTPNPSSDANSPDPIEKSILDQVEDSEEKAREKKEAEKPQSRLDAITKSRLERARKHVRNDLRDGIDLNALAQLGRDDAEDEIFTAVEEINRFRSLELSATELNRIAQEAADDMLGFGPLEKLLKQDGINDIMINGPKEIFVEKDGKMTKSNVKFANDQHLLTVCQRIVGAIGRRVDESSPICDARLPDGSRVNVIIPPLAVDGAAMTIRKFTKEKLTLDKLIEFGTLTEPMAKILQIASYSRTNILISGGTGSGKTTMLNCLTRYISDKERIITCEDACELQLQQPHVVRLETRPQNLEGVGEVTMRDLVKNCLRMRPDRIIVGEVRGPEAFDLLQAMNTGHDGSLGTIHANNPREALSRMENMIAMGNLSIPTLAVREQIAAAVNLVIQVQRLRDGSRKVTHVTEITGMEGDVVTMQELAKFEYEGEDEDGNIVGKQVSTGLRPKFYDRARQYSKGQELMEAIEASYDGDSLPGEKG